MFFEACFFENIQCRQHLRKHLFRARVWKFLIFACSSNPKSCFRVLVVLPSISKVLQTRIYVHEVCAGSLKISYVDFFPWIAQPAHLLFWFRCFAVSWSSTAPASSRRWRRVITLYFVVVQPLCLAAVVAHCRRVNADYHMGILYDIVTLR